MADWIPAPALRLAAELRRDAFSPRAIPAAAAGFTSGLGFLVAMVAFGTHIFSGALAPYASQGVGLILFGNFAACLVIALTGGFRGAISGLPAALVIVMAQVGATVDAEGDTLFATTAAALVVGAVAAGTCFFLIGRFRFANLVRFVPYSVAGGFVAGIGGAVCLAALEMMGPGADRNGIAAFLAPATLAKWAPGLAFGVGLYLALKRWERPLVMPVSFALATGAAHLALRFLDVPASEARADGFLLTGTSDGALWPALTPADLTFVDWGAMAASVPVLLLLVLVALIVVIMNLAGLEMAANQDLDWNREFRAAGLASLVAGVGGGTAGSVIVSPTLRSRLLGADSRLTGVVAALVLATALLFGDGMIELVPVPLVGGILVFAGLGMLEQGLLRTRKRLPWSEYGVIVLIAVVIVAFGLFEGVALGMLATLVFFAVRLSRVNPIASRFTARNRHSTRARSIPDRVILQEEGERVVGFQLRGYIFFGSVVPLAEQLKTSLRRRPRPACLVLDLARVSGFDISAVNVLARFLGSARKRGVPVILSGAAGTVRTGLERALTPTAFRALRLEADADRALERAEDIVIAWWRAQVADERRASLLERSADDLERHLERQIRFEDLLGELEPWLKPLRYAAGEVVAGPGVASEGLQLLVRGRASAHQAAGARSRQYSPGDAIWPVNASNRRAPAVSADSACETRLLTPATRIWLEQHEQKLALDLYRYLLAGRLAGEPPSSRPKTGNE